MGTGSAVLSPIPAAFRFGRRNRATRIRGAGLQSGATPPPRVRADARASGATTTSSGARVTTWTHAVTWDRRLASSFPPSRRGAVPRAAGDGVGGGALVPAQVAKLKVAELRAELERLGLATTGKKAELQARLTAATAEDADGRRAADGPAGGGDAASELDDSSDAKRTPSGVAASEDSTYLTEPEPVPSSEGDASAASSGETKTERSRSIRGGSFQRTMFNSRPAENVSGGDEIGADSVTNFSGMELTFLGTSSGSPSFTRNVSSYALRLTDEIWLFDCGEATQHQLMRSNLRYSKITRIFITHMHGDHIFGLPGLICALSGASAEKRRVHGKDPDPLYITGPPGICEYVKAAITCSRTVLGLPLVVTELTAPGNGVPGAGADDGANDTRAIAKQTHFAADARQKMFLGERWPDNGAATAPHFKDREGWSAAWDGSLTLPYWTVHREKPRNAGGERGGKSGGLVVRAAPLRHPVPCFGYVIDEPDQAGRIDAERCIQLGLPPGKEYARLKAGFDVQTKEGKTITPAMVLGCDRPGRRLCLLGDTCDSIGIARLARGADVLVHESTFAAYKHQEAVYKGHSTSVMAGEFARLIKARNLLLTHFSNRYGTANTRRGGTDGSESAFEKREEEDDIEDDMALPEGAPEDMRAAAQEEFTLVEGLVREAAQAKGDARVVAASDFFVFNVQRRERFDETDDAKGDRDALFDGPLVAPTLETYEDAKARMDAGVKGYYSQNYGQYSGERGAPQSAQERARDANRGRGGYRGRGRARTLRGRSESGYAGYPSGGRGGRFARADDGTFQRRQTYEGEEGRPSARRDALQTKNALPSRAAPRAGRAFDAETASIDSASFVRDFNRRGEE